MRASGSRSGRVGGAPAGVKVAAAARVHLGRAHGAFLPRAARAAHVVLARSGAVGILSRLDMRLQELIPPEHILLGLEAADKWAVIERLTAHLCARGALQAGQERVFREAVVSRERSMSTGMERGIAIPHAAVDGIEHVIAGLAVVRGSDGAGVPFDSIDDVPAWLVVLLLIPRPQKLLHIRTLADLARHLGNEDVRRALRSAATPTEAWQALARH